MRVYFCNDTSEYHAGSKAVCDYIKQTLVKKNHEIVYEDFGLKEVELINSCDVVLVNGEGTMHHNSKRAQKLLSALALGQKFGKATHLINTVWQSMGTEHKRVIRKLDSFIVREVLSQNESENTMSITPQVSLDFSYWTKIPQEESKCKVNETKGVIVTDFYSKEFGCFAKPTGGWLSKFPYIDIKKSNWDEMHKYLKSQSLLISGRHHAIYACCVSKTPFLPFSGNTHKVEGLIKSAGVCIPVAKTIKELKENFKDLEEIKKECVKLFDWMEKQPKWIGF